MDKVGKKDKDILQDYDTQVKGNMVFNRIHELS